MEIWGRDNLDSSNAYHVGKVCYTEDQITVYNLYVSNLPDEVTSKDLEKYFSHYGEISSVKIIQKRRTKIRPVFRYAFVNFTNAESAAQALRNLVHEVRKTKIKVKAADSWKQPRNTNISTKNDDDDDDDKETVPPNSILNLNDDCLLHIFSFLSISERLKMTGLNKRFENIFEMLMKKDKTLDFIAIGNLTLMEVRQIVKTFGHLIERISVSGDFVPNNHKRFIEFLPNFCPNLKIFELRSVGGIHAETFRRISHTLKFIKKMELINCDVGDIVCLHLSRLTNLETLNLSENYELTGKYIDKFTNLKSLSLNNCANIQPTFFANICENLKSLKELNIKRCDRLTELSYNYMVNNLQDLEILTLSTNYQAEQLVKIAELQKLKSLTIYCTHIRDDLFVKLSAKDDKIEKLNIFGGHLNDEKLEAIKLITSIKELRLPHHIVINDAFLYGIAKWKSLTYLDISGCKTVTKSGIIRFLDTSESIKTLDISSCSQFSEDLIFDVIDVLKLKNRHDPYTLIIGKTDIHSSIVENTKVTESKSFLKLSFEYNLTGLQFSLLNDDDDDFYLTDEIDYDGIMDDIDDEYDNYDSGDDYNRFGDYCFDGTDEYDTDDDYGLLLR